MANLTQKIRQIIKPISKMVGLYSLAKYIERSVYERYNNWHWLLLNHIHYLMKIDKKTIQNLSNEFDAMGFLKTIESQVSEHVSAQENYIHGTSSQQDLRVLYIFCRLLQPEVAVETGVASGASSFVLLSAMEKNNKGRLYSIDMPSEYWPERLGEYKEIDKVNLPKDKQTGWLVPQHLKKRWSLVIGDVREAVPKVIKEIGHCDMWYHDSEHTYDGMLWEFQTAWSCLKDGGVLVSDDIHWNNAYQVFLNERKGNAAAKAWRGFGMIRKLSNGIK